MVEINLPLLLIPILTFTWYSLDIYIFLASSSFFSQDPILHFLHSPYWHQQRFWVYEQTKGLPFQLCTSPAGFSNRHNRVNIYLPCVLISFFLNHLIGSTNVYDCYGILQWTSLCSHKLSGPLTDPALRRNIPLIHSKLQRNLSSIYIQH